MFAKVSDKLHSRKTHSNNNHLHSSQPSTPQVTSSPSLQPPGALNGQQVTQQSHSHESQNIVQQPEKPSQQNSPYTPVLQSEREVAHSSVPQVVPESTPRTDYPNNLAEPTTLTAAHLDRALQLGPSLQTEQDESPANTTVHTTPMTSALAPQSLSQQTGMEVDGVTDQSHLTTVISHERAMEKALEAQKQSAAAQINLHEASQQARVAAINAAATTAALKSVNDTLATSSSPQPGASSTTPALRKTAGRYALADFQIERTLGTGSFGRVHLVRSRHNGRFYAIKVLAKEKVIRMKQVEHTNSEREMLVRVRHPFLVNLWGTFQDVNNLYMVMDFVAGGELFSLLRKSQRFPNSVAKFYAAEVALALDYLHSRDIIYRDLKPENLLLGADGHLKVTDFGFAKLVPDITWTLCGTPDYLAPEVVQSKGYNKSVDWYALGVLIFEMLAGYPPFFTEDGNPMKLYEKIIAGKVRYPTYFDTLAKELLKNLLIADLTKRYGNLRAGSSDIFAHGWFAEVDWDKLYRREIPAPYVPKIEGDGDASQFDRYQEADVSDYGREGEGQYDHYFTDF